MGIVGPRLQQAYLDALIIIVEENIICREKHSERLKQFYLDSARSRESVCVARDDYDQSCPVKLLKHADHGIFGSSLFLRVVGQRGWVASPTCITNMTVGDSGQSCHFWGVVVPHYPGPNV
ncbi:hypothetical protein KSP39_PZI012207 [Platanthera zijinensis]|uniref:Uncharacterized protein n=1 Tax=Platanthera zijinensis TaxID=2320716 RepID=A0AAP0BEY2_9ASPA